MKKLTYHLPALSIGALALVYSACNPPEQAEEGTDTNAVEDTPDEDIAEVEPVDEGGPAFATGIASVKREPTKDKKIEIAADDGSTKKVSNWVGTVNRGEEVEWLDTDGEWAKVRLSDDKEGWIESKRILKVDEVTITVATDEVKTYSRPDMLNLNTKRTIEPGSLVFIIRDKNEFSEVDMPINHYSSLSAWVVKSKLNTDEREIAAARLFTKWKYLDSEKKSDAVDIAGLIKSEFSDTTVAALILKAEEDASMNEGEGEEIPQEPIEAE